MEKQLQVIKNEEVTPREKEWTREQIELIKRTVAQGATDDELKLFLYQAKKYGLDPLMKEIVFTKFKLKDGTEKVSIITTRDGYLKIAQSHPDFQGIISFTVCEGDTFEIDAANYQITHRFGTKRGKIIGAWARVDRRGYKPFIAFVPFDEYNQNTTTWQKYPSAMIQKVAETFALKRAFNISGIVTREELGIEDETVEIPKTELIHEPVVENNSPREESVSLSQTRQENKPETGLDQPTRVVYFPTILETRELEGKSGKFYEIKIADGDEVLYVFSKEALPGDITEIALKEKNGKWIVTGAK